MAPRITKEPETMHPRPSGIRVPAIFLAALLAALNAAPVHAASRGGARGALPRVASPSPADRILIVAPHIDDEAIAAAGYVNAARAEGAEVYVVYLTAGDCNRTSARMLGHTLRPKPGVFLRVGERRYGEALDAMARLGIPRANLFLLGYPDRGLGAMLDAPDRVVRSRGTGVTAVPYTAAVSPGAEYRLGNAVRDLEAVLRATQPTEVLLPVPFDAHRDHSAASQIAQRALAASGLAPRTLGYLVHAHHFPAPFLPSSRRSLLPPPAFAAQPWTVFPLTAEQVRQKKRVLQAYRSQRRDPYLYLLTTAFVRRNELFVDLSASAVAAVRP
jgi:LmbE family N-acetylglucosaminyl deacetylase